VIVQESRVSVRRSEIAPARAVYRTNTPNKENRKPSRAFAGGGSAISAAEDVLYRSDIGAKMR
jgi:hypothetical protein